MKRLSFSIFALWLTTAPFAQACDYCQKQVTLSKGLAQCYLDLYEDEINRMKESGLPAQLINLSICDGVDEVTRGTGELSIGPRATDEKRQVTTSFLLDEGGLVCLANELSNENWPTGSETESTLVKTFEVTSDC